MLSLLWLSYHGRSVNRIYTDGGASWAGDPGDRIQRLTDVDVEFWRFVAWVQRDV